MKMQSIVVISVIVIAALALIFIMPNAAKKGGADKNLINESLDENYSGDDFEEIYLAGGCFWGVEEYMERINGVIDVSSGYANGKTENPSYEEVIYNNTGHAETVHVKYDPEIIDLKGVLLYYFKVINPTSVNKQGNDRGSQYRTGIYYVNEDQVDIIKDVIAKEQEDHEKQIVVEVEPIDNYYLAEEYHQNYLKKNPNGYCHIDLSLAGDEIERDDLDIKTDKVNKVDKDLYSKPSEEEIKEKLEKNQYNITQKNSTERAFTHEYNDLDEKGIYVDIVTGEPLFSSDDKFDSGTGWPSFTKPIESDVIKGENDKSLGIDRLEIKSRVGDSHLGHVFDDGPADKGGKRYCINGASLKFVAYDDMEEEGYGYLKDIFE